MEEDAVSRLAGHLWQLVWWSRVSNMDTIRRETDLAFTVAALALGMDQRKLRVAVEDTVTETLAENYSTPVTKVTRKVEEAIRSAMTEN